MSLHKHRIHLFFSVFWMTMCIISIASASLMLKHYKEDVTFYQVFSLSFYYLLPAILWIILTPFIIHLASRMPLQQSHWKKYILVHLGVSFLLAPITRFTALIFDFSIKRIFRMVEEPVFEIIQDVIWVVWASIPREVLNYWLIVGVISAFHIYQELMDRPYQTGKLILNQHGQKIWLEVKEILAIEANGNYLKVHTKNQTFEIRKTLKQVLKELDTEQFFQVHRSTIINVSAIHSMQHWRRGEYLIQLIDGRNVTSSRGFRSNMELILQSR